jgi:membrane protease YdiL (CAAX protease family)
VRRSTPVPAWFVLLGLLAAASVAFALAAFPRAFPLVQVDLRMDRSGALAAASELAERYGWGPEGYRSAASFGDADASARRFLELEGGVAGTGVPAALEGRGLSAYLWRVRYVRERDATEVEVRFTPAGAPYGFRLTLPEDAPGPDLAVEEARALAEDGARDWGFAPGLYTPVEASRTLRPGGRSDHTFVYLRTGSEVADAEARLRLEVAGDRLSAVEPYLRVPEAFLRRFEEMRSANQRIAFGASAFFLLVLVAGGCGAGIFFLIRADAVAWRPSLVLGGVIALLAALSIVNGLPLAWMDYDSALPESLFLLTSGLLVPVGILAGGTLFFAWVIASAEGLGRMAFPSHPAFWRVWSRTAAPTPEIAGRTLGGYMVAAVELGWVVAFYLLAGRLEGWWTPADALVSPDLLATYQPWLQAVALSLMAGVWEESVFRAVPLAGAALLGRRFGRPALWIGVALVVQAVAFGAAHADYPQQPAYARVVELAPSALLWGIIYLRYGLLPVILTHSIYNLTLFSLPLFALSAPGIGLHRAVVVVAGLLPLGVVAWRRLQGHGGALREGEMNRGWLPSGAGVTPAFAPPEPRHPGAVPDRVRLRRPVPTWTIPAAAFIGLALWLGGRPHLPADLRLAGERNRATEQAREALRARGVDPGDWTVTVRPSSPWGQEASFLRLEGGRGAVEEALRTGHLPSPAWIVRLARFRGPVEERAEEWRVEVEGDRVRRMVHRLPEGRAGGRLDESRARALAEEALRQEGWTPFALRPVSARAEDLPARQDWTLVWSDPSVEVPAGGEARITVRLSGDEVADVVRSIHVPENWERERRERTSRFLLTLIPLFMVVGGGALLAALGGLVGVARRSIPGRPVAMVATALLAIALLHALNGLPGINATASTTTSLADQRVQGLLGALLGNVFMACFLALGLGFAARHAGILEPGSTVSRNAGGALGLLLAGAWTVASRFIPPESIPTPEVAGAGDVVPWLAELGTLPGSFATLVGLLLLGTALVRRLDSGRRAGWTPAILVLGGALLLPGGPDTPVLVRALSGGVAGGLLLAVGRSAAVAGASFLPALAAGLVLPDAMAPMLDRPFAGAAAGGVVGVSLLLVLGRGAVLFLESLSASGAHPGPAPPGGDPPATNASDTGP